MTLTKKYLILISSILIFLNPKILYADEKVEAIIDQMQIISQDLKTLEKAFYKKSDVVVKHNSTTSFASSFVPSPPFDQ